LEAVKEKDLKICVSIYPSGVQPKGSNKAEIPAHVNFNTPEQKERYVEFEYRFCKKQFAEYEGSLTNEDRFRARERLQACRVAFAKSQNFGPMLDGKGKPVDKWQWYFKGKDEATELA
jgi:hypothetical protein